MDGVTLLKDDIPPNRLLYTGIRNSFCIDDHKEDRLLVWNESPTSSNPDSSSDPESELRYHDSSALDSSIDYNETMSTLRSLYSYFSSYIAPQCPSTSPFDGNHCPHIPCDRYGLMDALHDHSASSYLGYHIALIEIEGNESMRSSPGHPLDLVSWHEDASYPPISRSVGCMASHDSHGILLESYYSHLYSSRSH